MNTVFFTLISILALFSDLACNQDLEKYHAEKKLAYHHRVVMLNNTGDTHHLHGQWEADLWHQGWSI